MFSSQNGKITTPIRFLYVSIGGLFVVAMGGFCLLNQIGSLRLLILSGVGMSVVAVVISRWFIRLTFKALLRHVASEIRDIGSDDQSPSTERAAPSFLPELRLVYGEIAEKSAAIQRRLRVIRELTDSIIATSSEIEEASGEHLTISNKQATSIVKATSTVHNIRRTGEASRDQSHHIITLADQSARISEEGLTAVESTNRVNLQISEQVRNIVERTEALRGQVLESTQSTEKIKEIAGRLSILSVNAAIEAAKAGEFGRGFNVVAQEIKALNTQSKQATKDVEERLDNIESTMLKVLNAANEGYSESLSGINSIKNVRQVIQQLSEIISRSIQNASLISESFDTQMSGIYKISDEMKSLNVSAMASVKGTMQIKERIGCIRKTFVEFQETAVLSPVTEGPRDEAKTGRGEENEDNRRE